MNGMSKQDFLQKLTASKKTISEKKYTPLLEKEYDSRVFKPSVRNEHINSIEREMYNQYVLNNMRNNGSLPVDNLVEK